MKKKMIAATDGQESKITQGHDDSQNTQTLQKCTVFARKQSEKCLNRVLRFVPGQMKPQVTPG